MNRLILTIGIITILTACEFIESNNSRADPEYGNLPKDLVKKIKGIAPKTQQFEIDPTINNSIVCDSGTVIIIPKNSITDMSGNKVGDKINLFVKEHFTIGDYLLSNLQTIHNDKLLETAGMIYLTASDKDGKSLKVKKGKSLRVEVPTKNVNTPKIFLGKRTESGLMNWGEIREPTKSLSCFPILYISQHHLPDGYATECLEYYGIVPYEVPESDIGFHLQDDITKYEQTFLATKEFKNRYDVYCAPELVKLYISNLDKNLWEVDQMMVEKLKRDSIRDLEYYYNDQRTNITVDQKEAHHWLTEQAENYYTHIVNRFRTFAAQKLTKVDTTIKADTLIIDNNIDSYESYVKTYEVKTVFEAIDFGWINVDIFYNDPRAVQLRL